MSAWQNSRSVRLSTSKRPKGRRAVAPRDDHIDDGHDPRGARGISDSRTRPPRDWSDIAGFRWTSAKAFRGFLQPRNDLLAHDAVLPADPRPRRAIGAPRPPDAGPLTDPSQRLGAITRKPSSGSRRGSQTGARSARTRRFPCACVSNIRVVTSCGPRSSAVSPLLAPEPKRSGDPGANMGEPHVRGCGTRP